MNINTNSALSSADAYTDLNSLNDVKKLGRNKDPQAIMKVAQEFESYFISQLMKEMRSCVDLIGKDNFANTGEMQFHQQMFDQQMSMEMAGKGGYGLADMLARQMMNQYQLDWQSASESQPVTQRILPTAVTSSSLARVAAPGAETNLSAKTTSDAANAKVSAENINRDNFLSALSEHAEQAANRLGVNKNVLLAQAALETGWGEHITANATGSSNNLFNIKSDGRWQGDSVQVTTVEYRDGVAARERANFRSYDTIAESFDDYVQFMQGNPRYQKALECAADNQAYVEHLQAAGYATDPDYASKIMAILQRPEFNGQQ
ncbi:flagellar assembly peptidoglycan hydrolase FlgJ [Halioxenophilus sp. WMMB6]|uniref:flagellar assembly peptidoglycan hydrolase FlgJ n=1 Tax=Halioxenophilus sp. WMMB6 TaxID=3073815 RepID=UPI00295E970C|nr:flagellar assembly peptidoglycan hydrolase FlgJ [Halioxenophilus sp. WMMB6]